MIKLSIIIPAYNTAVYLSECIDSVLSQSLHDIEVICVNDGSPDNSLEIMRQYAGKDSRVRVIDKKNEGVGIARNAGIMAAQGEFIAFMDSDDYYPHNTVLEKLYSAAVENSVAICGGRYKMVYPDGQTEDCVPAYKELDCACSGVTAYRDFQYDYTFWAHIFKTSMLREKQIFFPSYSRFQDPPFFVKAMIAADKFCALPEAVYCYRSVLSKAKHSMPKTLDMLRGIMDNLQISREHNLARLHFITASRLNEEGSYMAINNLYDEKRKDLLALLIKANSMVDCEWLRQEGYKLPEPFVLDVFLHAVSTAEQYECMRKGLFRKIISWIPRHL